MNVKSILTVAIAGLAVVALSSCASTDPVEAPAEETVQSADPSPQEEEVAPVASGECPEELVNGYTMSPGISNVRTADVAQYATVHGVSLPSAPDCGFIYTTGGADEVIIIWWDADADGIVGALEAAGYSNPSPESSGWFSSASGPNIEFTPGPDRVWPAGGLDELQPTSALMHTTS